MVRKEEKLKILLSFFALIVVILAISFLTDKSLTGNVISLDKSYFLPNEQINGEYGLSLKAGELIPENSIVRIEYANEIKEYSLKEFIELTSPNLNQEYGFFYVENANLKGEGFGYGKAGKIITYPEIYFKLKIFNVNITINETNITINETEINITEINETETNITIEINQTTQPEENETIEEPIIIEDENETETPEEPVEEIPEEETIIEEPTEPVEPEQPEEEIPIEEEAGMNEGSEETSESGEESESSEPEETPKSSDSNPITGNFITFFAIANKFLGFWNGLIIEDSTSIIDNEISASVSKEYPFYYTLKENEDADLISGSVNDGNETFEDNVVNIKRTEQGIKITTDYSNIEYGFGKDYLGEIGEYEFDLDKLNISLNETGEYSLKISITYEDKIIDEQEIQFAIIDGIKIKIINRKGQILDEVNLNDSEVEIKINKERINGKEVYQIKEVKEGNKEETENNILTGKVIIEQELPEISLNFQEIPNDLIIQIDKPTQKNFGTEIIAIESESKQEFLMDESKITLEKTTQNEINNIIYCDDWNIDSFSCNNEWRDSELEFIDNGTHVSFNVTHFTAYTGNYTDESLTTNLMIWDLTDSEGGSQTIYVNENNTFYANYTNSTSNESINGTDIWCEFYENSSGSWSAVENMTFNEESLIYELSRNITEAGEFYFNVSCIDNNGDFDNLTVLDDFTITPIGDGCVGEHYVFTCGGTVNESCVMDENLSGSGSCFTINESNIILDCAGFTIDGDDTAGSYGISSNGFSNVTIKNCIITDFESGILFNSTAYEYTSSGAIINSSMNSNFYGVLFYYAENVTVENNSASGNADIGFFTVASRNINLTKNDATSSPNGFNIGYGSQYNILKENYISSITSNGFYIYNSPNNEITNNTAETSNRGFTIELSGSYSNKFTNNYVTDCTIGFYFNEAGNSNRLLGNNITTLKSQSNPRNGIYLQGSDIVAYQQDINESNIIDGKPTKYYDGVAEICPDNQEINISNYSFTGFVGCKNITAISSSLDMDSVFLWFTNDSTIRGLNISNSYYAVLVSYGINNTFEDIFVNYPYYGISLHNSERNTIKDSSVSYGGNGIHIYQSHNNHLENVSALSCSNIGIYISASENNNITNSRMNSNVWGVLFRDFSHYNLLENNTANSNTGAGFYLHINCSNNTLINNSATGNPRGTWLDYDSSGNKFINNTMYSNSFGFHASRNADDNLFQNNVVYGNTLSGTSAGFLLDFNSINNTFENNIVYSNREGFRSYCSNNSFTGNTVYDNQQYGFRFISVSKIHLENNLLYNNPSGDLYLNSAINTIAKNNAFENITISFSYSGDFNIKSVSSCPTPPGNNTLIERCISIDNLSSAWMYLNISYKDSDWQNAGVIKESSLRIWKYDGAEWINQTGTSIRGVNTNANYVYANITQFSVFAPVEEPQIGNGGGGTTRHKIECGNGICEYNENCTTCPQDCGICFIYPVCGNLICETEETYVTCPNDCCALQGQEITIIGGISSSATSQKCCSGLTAVDIYTNLTSCILTSETNKKVCINCGNRLCEAGENNCNCPTDCPVNCTSAGQTTKIENCCPGLTALRIYKDVENCLGISDEFICSNCGNAICENYENKCNCPTDCNITNVTLQWAISNFTMNCSDFTQGSFTLSIDTSITERVDIKLPVPCEYRTGISGCYPISECSYKDIPGFCGRLPTYNVIKSDKIDSLRNLFLENGTFNRTAIDINTTLLNATIPGQNTVLTPATDTEGTLDRTTAIGLSSDDSLYIKNKDKLNFAIGGTTATDFTFNADQDILNRLKFYKAIQYETFTTYGVENRCKLSCSNSPINQQVLESISNVAGKILNLQINKAYFYDCQGNSVGEGNYKCSDITAIKCSITQGYEGWHAILSNGSAMRITTGNCAGARYYCPIESNPIVRFNQTIQKSQSTTRNTSINWIVAPAGISSADGLLQLTKADYVAEWNPATQSSKGAAYGKLYTTTTPRDPRTIEKIVISPEKLPLTGLATYPIGPISYPIYPIISEDVYITGNFNVTPGKPYFISYDKTQNNNLDSYDMIYMGDVPSPVTFDLRVGENYLVLPFNTTIKKASQLCKIADGTGKIISRSSTISRFNVNLQIVESAVEGYTCYEIDEQHLEDFDLIPGKVYRIDLDFGRSATWTQE